MSVDTSAANDVPPSPGRVSSPLDCPKQQKSACDGMNEKEVASFYWKQCYLDDPFAEGEEKLLIRARNSESARKAKPRKSCITPKSKYECTIVAPRTAPVQRTKKNKIQFLESRAVEFETR